MQLVYTNWPHDGTGICTDLSVDRLTRFSNKPEARSAESL
jgi:hypothetical protein